MSDDDKLEFPDHVKPQHMTAGSSLIVALVALAVLSGVAGGVAIASFIRDRTDGPQQPVTVEACDPADFNGERCADGALPPLSQRGTVLTLTEDLEIPVAGRVLNEADTDIAYEVTVSWVAVDVNEELGAKFPLIDVPVTWEAGRNEPYELAWGPPTQLLTLVDQADYEPGESLGRWRIVGEAIPINNVRWLPYLWTSVGTFELVAE